MSLKTLVNYSFLGRYRFKNLSFFGVNVVLKTLVFVGVDGVLKTLVFCDRLVL